MKEPLTNQPMPLHDISIIKEIKGDVKNRPEENTEKSEP